MKNLKQIVKDVSRAGIVIGISSYLGFVASSYAIIDTYRTEIENKTRIKREVDFNNLYNPLRFYRDNKKIIEEGKKLEKPIPQNTITGTFPTIG